VFESLSKGCPEVQGRWQVMIDEKETSTSATNGWWREGGGGRGATSLRGLSVNKMPKTSGWKMQMRNICWARCDLNAFLCVGGGEIRRGRQKS
jgi:hypothetical protein